MNLTTTILAAAVGGILMGCGGATPSANAPTDTPVAGAPASASSTPTTGSAKHACKGQNDCKGQGGCKTDKHACKGQNDCKGQGGCKG
jgi:hypothetical protein